MYFENFSRNFQSDAVRVKEERWRYNVSEMDDFRETKAFLCDKLRFVW